MKYVYTFFHFLHGIKLKNRGKRNFGTSRIPPDIFGVRASIIQNTVFNLVLFLNMIGCFSAKAPMEWGGIGTMTPNIEVHIVVGVVQQNLESGFTKAC